MIKLFFSLLLCILAGATAEAQVVLQPPALPGGLVQKNQLWNVLIINSSNNNYTECRVNLLLRDRLTGQEVFSASSAQFTIAPGAKQLGTSLLNPIQYNYLSSSVGSDLQAFIPAGIYTACYSLSGTFNKTVDLAEECIQIEATPLSPPMLIFPADSAVLETAPNQFSWTPPTPPAMFDRLQYDVLITEIREGQKPAEALQQNLPFYNQGNVASTVLNYPASAIALEKGKWYAWQVVARDDRAYAGKSEVWVFSFGSDKAGSNDIGSYARFSRSYTGKVYYFSDVINMSFNNPYTAGKLKYDITAIKTNKKLKGLPVINMEEGLNTISLKTASIKGLKKNEQYVMTIHNLGTADQFLNFFIK